MDLFNSCDHASVHIQVPGSYQRQYGLQPCPRTESPLFPHSIVPETHYDSHGLLNGRPGQCSTLNRSITNCAEGAPFLGYGQFFDVDPLLARYCVVDDDESLPRFFPFSGEIVRMMTHFQKAKRLERVLDMCHQIFKTVLVLLPF
jgi:hypothetical protein